MTTSAVVSGQPLPVLVLGDARRRALTLRISNDVKGWLKNWGALGVEPDVSVELTKCAEVQPQTLASSGGGISGAIGGTACLTISARDGLFGSLLNLPRGVGSMSFSAESKIADAARVQILRALADAMVAGLPVESWQVQTAHEKSSQAATPRKYDHWWIANVGLGSQQNLLELMLSPALICQLVPLSIKPNKAALDKRKGAIGEEKLQLEAVLGEASVSLGELASLAINDVIVLRDELSQPSYLVTSTGHRVANVSLGRIGSKRAAVIVK